MSRFIPSFRGHRHSEASRLKISRALRRNHPQRGKTYEQIFGPNGAEYQKALRRQFRATQTNFSFAGWSHTAAAKQRISAAMKAVRRKQTKSVGRKERAITAAVRRDRK